MSERRDFTLYEAEQLADAISPRLMEQISREMGQRFDKLEDRFANAMEEHITDNSRHIGALEVDLSQVKNDVKDLRWLMVKTAAGVAAIVTLGWYTLKAFVVKKMGW